MPVRVIQSNTTRADKTVQAVNAAFAAARLPVPYVDVQSSARVSDARIRNAYSTDDAVSWDAILSPPDISVLIDTARHVVVMSPVDWFLVQIAGGATKRVGEEVFSALMRFFAALRSAPSKTSKAPVVLRDPMRDLEVELTNSLPREAFVALYDLDLTGLSATRLHYELTRGEWVMGVPKKKPKRQTRSPRGHRRTPASMTATQE
jgi:hypothetical protein